MIGLILGLVLAVSMVTLGIKGFQEQGIPWSSTKSITGTPAKLIGSVCIVLGLLLALLLILVTGFHLLTH